MNKPLLFRFHRGLLKDSMDTVREILSFEQLLLMISIEWEFEPNEIRIEKYAYDDRIQWDTRIVLAKFKSLNQIGFSPVGFLNRAPDWRHLQGDKLEICH
jgi:hypothetical protein